MCHSLTVTFLYMSSASFTCDNDLFVNVTMFVFLFFNVCDMCHSLSVTLLYMSSVSFTCDNDLFVNVTIFVFPFFST